MTGIPTFDVYAGLGELDLKQYRFLKEICLTCVYIVHV